MPSGTMQERIARAMTDARVSAMKKRFALDFDLPGYDEYTDEGRADALAEALAAMKAMREPTEEMEDAADDPFHEAWRKSNEYADKHGLKRGHASSSFFGPMWRAAIDREISIAEGGKDGD